MPKDVAAASTSLARSNARQAPIARTLPSQSLTPEERFAVAGTTIKLNMTDIESELIGTTWPQNTTRVVDSEGNVDYFDAPSKEMERMWRKKVGTFLAHEVLKQPKNGKWYLTEWPDGYKLFVHKKGPSYSPRKDHYLYGPPHRIFRSPAEFFLHAKHLMLMRDECECKYCSGANQGEISHRYSHYNPKAPEPRRIRTAQDLLRR